MKVELKDLAFLILVRIDSIERIENLFASVDSLFCHVLKKTFLSLNIG